MTATLPTPADRALASLADAERRLAQARAKLADFERQETIAAQAAGVLNGEFQRLIRAALPDTLEAACEHFRAQVLAGQAAQEAGARARWLNTQVMTARQALATAEREMASDFDIAARRDLQHLYDRLGQLESLPYRGRADVEAAIKQAGEEVDTARAEWVRAWHERKDTTP